ncbi:MAG TPA: hypothetical protein VMP11_15755 [Verrucomicrobiae bacterium]|nr:hypothetical protein [Verrucomicrobiae bacterium]
MTWPQFKKRWSRYSGKESSAYGFPADLTDDRILERLLKLNLERAAAELKSGQTKKPKTSRAKQGDELI